MSSASANAAALMAAARGVIVPMKVALMYVSVAISMESQHRWPKTMRMTSKVPIVESDSEGKRQTSRKMNEVSYDPLDYCIAAMRC